MEREAFLARVRQAVQQGQAYRLDIPAVSDDVGYVGAAGDLATALAAQITNVGGQAEIVNGAPELERALDELLNLYQPKSALCWRHPLLAEWQVPRLLARHGIAGLDADLLAQLPADQRRQRFLGADIGISAVDLAVAETGTLVVMSRLGQERLTSLLPPVHVALVAREQIVPDLCDVFSHLGTLVPDSLPSNLAFITGPDIELQLTTGVHGPGKWHVLIVC
jgi:L-lactate dehydrogenase complex protein LldG